MMIKFSILTKINKDKDQLINIFIYLSYLNCSSDVSSDLLILTDSISLYSFFTSTSFTTDG